MLVLDGDQIARLIESVTGTTLYMSTLLAITTGMRRGEILALRWMDIDLDRGMLSVTRTLEKSRKGGLQFKQPKKKRRKAAATSRSPRSQYRH